MSDFGPRHVFGSNPQGELNPPDARTARFHARRAEIDAELALEMKLLEARQKAERTKLAQHYHELYRANAVSAGFRRN
jgi:hypothetical protein